MNIDKNSNIVQRRTQNKSSGIKELPTHSTQNKQNSQISTEELFDHSFSQENDIECLLLLFYIAFFLSIIVAGFVLINSISKGDFGRLVVGIFPRETETLKIKDYLLTAYLSHKRIS